VCTQHLHSLIVHFRYGTHLVTTKLQVHEKQMHKDGVSMVLVLKVGVNELLDISLDIT
jgi:hypothetical protein